MAPNIDSGDIFRLRNDHPSEELVVTLNKKAYRVAPGKVALVPFELVRVYWGDPRARPNIYVKFADSKERGWVNKRELEIARLGNLYGTFASDVAALNDPDWPIGDPRRGIQPRLVPWPVSVQTESGEPVIPCCFDESGERVYPAVNGETQDLNDQVAYREHLEQRLDEISLELRKVKGMEDGDDAEVDIPVSR